MNALVLALIGQIPHDEIGRGMGHLAEIRDQAWHHRAAGRSRRAYPRATEVAAKKTAKAHCLDAFWGLSAPPHPECAIDVWGKRQSRPQYRHPCPALAKTGASMTKRRARGSQGFSAKPSA